MGSNCSRRRSAQNSFENAEEEWELIPLAHFDAAQAPNAHNVAAPKFEAHQIDATNDVQSLRKFRNAARKIIRMVKYKNVTAVAA